MDNEFQESAIWFYEVWKLGQGSNYMNNAGFMEYMAIRDKADRDFGFEIIRWHNQIKAVDVSPGSMKLMEYYDYPEGKA